MRADSRHREGAHVAGEEARDDEHGDGKRRGHEEDNEAAHGSRHAPTGCLVTTDIGNKAFVPYSADYFFYWKSTEDEHDDR